MAIFSFSHQFTSEAIRFFRSFNLFLVISPDFGLTKISLVRLVWPDRMSRQDLGTSRHFAKNVTHILLAALSTGAAVSLIFSFSPWIPVIEFFDDRGWTWTVKIRPWGCFRMGIIISKAAAGYSTGWARIFYFVDEFGG